MLTMKVILLLFLISTASGYHILCINTAPTRSHYQLMKGIVDALLRADHQVTFITPLPKQKTEKNLTFIDASVLLKYEEEMNKNPHNKFDIKMKKKFGRDTAIGALQEKAVRKAIVSHQYDAVVTEWFFSDLHAGYAAVLEVPWIMLCGTLTIPTEQLVDSVRSVSTIPNIYNLFPIPMNFWQRILNTFSYLMITFDSWKSFSSAKFDYESTFGPLATYRGVALPPFEEVYNNISIMFVNSHPSFAPARSQPPNIIDIGGYHIDDDIPALPKDLQAIMDSSPQRVIYFSMGSVLRSSMLTEKNKQGLMQMFAELNYTVLWKFDGQVDNIPKNVYVRSWMPQTSILSHPNTRAFITHGGLLSSLEAFKYGVPMLVIPVFGDQPANAHKFFLKTLHHERKDLTPTFHNPDSYIKETKEVLKRITPRKSYFCEKMSTQNDTCNNYFKEDLYYYFHHENFDLDQCQALSNDSSTRGSVSIDNVSDLETNY
ncbi:unnamed protein product [Leptidea sinapis]|uniref:UDP-glucuronosyltransferase n=1 Tax=Leptidea sinapis TaxID=189913 RepID=A0A5E4QV06_9NEOP|nr:unnamed protein product [Leptidea sinapis]